MKNREKIYQKFLDELKEGDLYSFNNTIKFFIIKKTIRKEKIKVFVYNIGSYSEIKQFDTFFVTEYNFLHYKKL